jgi:hypothetical protein
MENAGPVVRYRTMTELMNVNDAELLRNTLSDVLSLPQTQKRLTQLKNLDFNRIHGSDSTHLENVLPMLNDFGLYFGMDSFLNDVKNNSSESEAFYGNANYNGIISYPFLLRSRYPINGLLEFVIERINTIYDFTRRMDFDIYDDAANHKNVPKPFRDRPIIKPSVACGNICRLPLIYDIVAMAEVYNRVPADIKHKIDNIVGYILSHNYDTVVFGYGILSAGSRKYYSMGWDCKKPFNDDQDYSYPNLHRLLLYSCFPTAVKSIWIKNAIDFLTQYKTSNGTYVFPKDYLRETDSNWVLGSHMSLAENRRKKDWIEIESTFYMQKLLNIFISNSSTI